MSDAQVFAVGWCIGCTILAAGLNAAVSVIVSYWARRDQEERNRKS